MKFSRTVFLALVLSTIVIVLYIFKTSNFQLTVKPHRNVWSLRQFENQQRNTTLIKKDYDTNLMKIAVGVAITSKGAEDVTESNLQYHFPFFQSLLSSFCKTSTQGYHYIFYVAYDRDDPFFTDKEKRLWFNSGWLFYTNLQTGPIYV